MKPVKWEFLSARRQHRGGTMWADFNVHCKKEGQNSIVEWSYMECFVAEYASNLERVLKADNFSNQHDRELASFNCRNFKKAVKAIESCANRKILRLSYG